MSRFLSFCVKADREMFHKYTKALPACYNYCQIQEPDRSRHCTNYRNTIPNAQWQPAEY